MTRYMKENKSAIRQNMKDAGVFADEMKKAIEDLDMDSGAVVEMNDLGPFIKDIVKFNEEMLKAMEMITGQVDTISAKSEETYELLRKAAKAQVDQAKDLKAYMDTPIGRKGKIADEKMHKANEFNQEGKFTPEENKAAYKVLMKAVKEKNTDAGMVISAFEAGGHDANRLRSNQKTFIRDLLAKEVN
jgi:hypothetical protein